MLFSVFIAVCLATTPVAECSHATAIGWVVAPEHPASLSGCARHGILYAAESHLVTRGSYAKIFCTIGERR